MKKSMLRKLSAILMICLVFSLMTTSGFADERSSKSLANANGEKLSVQSFEQKYVGKTNPDSTVSRNVMELNCSDIAYNNVTRELSFEASVSDGKKEMSIRISGTLYSSWKQEKGINSIVGKMETDNKNIKVLHFELYNDTSGSQYFGMHSFKQKPTLLLYLYDGKEVYLFETDIPEAMRSISVIRTANTMTKEASVDGFWFEDVIEPEMSASSTTIYAPIRPMANNTNPVAQQNFELSATWKIGGTKLCL